MSQPITIYWPPAVGNEAIISSSQSYTAPGNVILNSNVPSSQVNPANPNGPYIFDGVARALSFTSISGFAGDIIIQGIGTTLDINGNPGPFSLTTETLDIAIFDGDTVYTDSIWKQINSIHLSHGTGGFSVGFGNFGITNYIFMDSNRTGWYATAQVQAINPANETDGLKYTVYQTLTKPETPNIQYGNLDVFPQTIPATPVPFLINNVDVSPTGIVYGTWPSTGLLAYTFPKMIFPLTTPIAMVWASISDNNAADEALYFTVIQQGLRS